MHVLKGDLERIEYLGSGHAGKVYKVVDPKSGKLYAEKVRDSTPFAKRIYLLAFQAPPPDRNEHAVITAKLTRNLLKIILERWHNEDPGIPLIADAVGIKYSEEERAYSLITEFIEGRGPIPGTYEIFELMECMDTLSEKLFEAGLYGPAWQTDKSNMTSTANFKLNKKDNRWYWIDTEPGMIAIRLARKKRYIKAAKKAGFGPLFADIDFEKLRNYVKRERIEGLEGLIDDLEREMKEWKRSEISLFRDGGFDKNKVREWYVEAWTKERYLSNNTQKLLKKSTLAFYLYLVFGHLTSLALNDRYKSKIIEEKFKDLEEEEIVPKGYRKHVIANYILSALSPKVIHHYIMDKGFRKYVNKGFRSREHRKQIAYDFNDRGLEEWEKLGRISAEEANDNRKTLKENPVLDVYMAGFGAHLLLKGATLAGDIAAIANVLGTSGLMFLKPLTIEYLLHKGLPWPFNALFPLLIGPILRVIYVGYSALRCKLERRKVPHKTAAIVSFGKFGVGTMAFPAQMAFSGRKFTLQYLLSKLGKKIPIFGGQDSRIEHWFIRRASRRKNIGKNREREKKSIETKSPSLE